MPAGILFTGRISIYESENPIFDARRNAGMEGISNFNQGESSSEVQQLSALYCLRHKLESRQQYLLIKSLLLTRFVRIAALKNLQSKPEITLARRLLAGVLPDLQPLQLSGNLHNLLQECSSFMGNRMN